MIVRTRTRIEYDKKAWRPWFAWRPVRLPSTLVQREGHKVVTTVTVWLEWIECKARDDDGCAPWIYRMKVD